MTDITIVQFRSPKFQLYELATLHWNSREHHTKIVQRWFNPDDGSQGYWFYQVSSSDKLYPEKVLEPRH